MIRDRGGVDVTGRSASEVCYIATETLFSCRLSSNEVQGRGIRCGMWAKLFALDPVRQSRPYESERLGEMVTDGGTEAKCF
jgi:hypothetical protein